eukprot:6490304-Pyramimonas_sp.AAC.1
MATAFAAHWGQLADEDALWTETDEYYHSFYAPLDHYTEPEQLGHDCHRAWGNHRRSSALYSGDQHGGVEHHRFGPTCSGSTTSTCTTNS